MVERDAHYVEMARRRMKWWSQFESHEQAKRAYDAARAERKVEQRRPPQLVQLLLFSLV
jgi:hypothetical protein